MSNLGNKEIMAKNIRYYMSLNNVRATDICEALHIPTPTFSDWINAKTYPRIDKIELMAYYFGINKSDLIEEHQVEEVQNELFQKRKLLFDMSAKASKDDLDKIISIVGTLLGDTSKEEQPTKPKSSLQQYTERNSNPSFTKKRNDYER